MTEHQKIPFIALHYFNPTRMYILWLTTWKKHISSARQPMEVVRSGRDPAHNSQRACHVHLWH